MSEWKIVEGFPMYEVSVSGDIRHREHKNPRKLWIEHSGHLTVTLRNPGERAKRLKVHRLVAKAFLDNTEGHPFVRHLNDVPGDNRLENLAWGTNSDNQYDSLRNGTHHSVHITHCPQDHEYTEENTALRGKRKSRFCKQCDRDTHSRNRKIGLPQGDPRHGKPTTRGNWGCNCEPCTLADRERLQKYQQR